MTDNEDSNGFQDVIEDDPTRIAGLKELLAAKDEALNVACQNLISLTAKCTQFTNALNKAMGLIDELLRENVRLCAASDQPPDVRLFAAKNSFDAAMKTLLGDQ